MHDLDQRIAKLEQSFAEFSSELRFALGYIRQDAGSSLTKSRIVLEKLLCRVYEMETGKPPKRPLLGDMLVDNQFTRHIERRIFSRMNAIRDMANLGPHGERVEAADATRVLDDLCEVLNWYIERYGQNAPVSASPAPPRPAVEPLDVLLPVAPPPKDSNRVTRFVGVFAGLGAAVGGVLAYIVETGPYPPYDLTPAVLVLPWSAMGAWAGFWLARRRVWRVCCTFSLYNGIVLFFLYNRMAHPGLWNDAVRVTFVTLFTGPISGYFWSVGLAWRDFAGRRIPGRPFPEPAYRLAVRIVFCLLGAILLFQTLLAGSLASLLLYKGNWLLN